LKNPTPFGKYCLLERISVGGMAEVFRAKTFGVQGFSKRIAIKRILPNMAEDSEFVTMFIDEAKIAAQLNHSNICQIYELGKIGKFHYIAMEHIHGKNLLQLQNRFRKGGEAMPPHMAAYVMQKVCEGLDYAHRKKDHNFVDLNVVHRDVSPQNVIVSFDGEVKIIDFGIAKASSRSTRTQVGVLKGKFGYMSPEQVRGLPLDRRSDVFAAGTVLYEILTAQRLFNAESDFATLEQVRKVDIDPPRAINPKIPEGLERITLKALTRDRDQRYQWGREVAEDLARFLQAYRPGYSAKDLADWMRGSYAEELEGEKEKLEFFSRIRSQKDLLALQPQPAAEPPTAEHPRAPADPDEIEEEATSVFAYDPAEGAPPAADPPALDARTLAGLVDSEITVQLDDDAPESASPTARPDPSEMATEAVQAISDEEYARIMAEAASQIRYDQIGPDTMPPPNRTPAPTLLPPDQAPAEGGPGVGDATLATPAVGPMAEAAATPFAPTAALPQVPPMASVSPDLVAGTMNLALDELEFVREHPDQAPGLPLGGGGAAQASPGASGQLRRDERGHAPTPSGSSSAALADTDSLQAVKRPVESLPPASQPSVPSAPSVAPSGAPQPAEADVAALQYAVTPAAGVPASTPAPSPAPPHGDPLGGPTLDQKRTIRLDPDDPELSALHDGPGDPLGAPDTVAEVPPVPAPPATPAPGSAELNPAASQPRAARPAKTSSAGRGRGLGIAVGVAVALVVVVLGVAAWFLGLRPLVQSWMRGSAALELSLAYPAEPPPGLRVLLDGNEVGTELPLTVEELEAGLHSLRVETEQYDRYEASVTLEEDGRLAYEVELVPKEELYGTLSVKLRPGGPARVDAGAGLQVEVAQGQQIATLQLRPGREYEVVVQGPGVLTVRRKVTLDFEEARSEDVVLEPYKGRLTLTSKPSRATVRINGRRVGRTPFDKTGLDPSVPYSIELRKRGYEIWAHSLRFSGERPTFEREVELTKPEPEPKPAPPEAAGGSAPPSATAAKGFVTISAATPLGEEVWVDGEKTGRRTPITSVSKLELPPGEHTILLKLGSRSRTVRVTIEEGKTRHVRKKRLRKTE